jgi:Autographiviridae RNA polymerase
LIEATAALKDERWLDAKEPFMFLACCTELVAARNNPKHQTHLPIAFDGASNVLVHFSALSRSDPLGIMGGYEPSTATPAPDTYDGDAVALYVATGISFSRDDAKPYGQRVNYGLSDFGIARQLEEMLEKSGHKLPSDRSERGKYIWKLGEKVRKEIEDRHPKAKEIMDCLRKLQEYMAKEWNEPLRVEMPSGFLWMNLYNKTRAKRIRALLDGIEIRPKVADGYLPKIRRGKSKSSVVANFIHGCDAAHMVRTVNACVYAGIKDKMAIHDCHFGLAPQAAELHGIILDQLALMYEGNTNPLDDVYRNALSLTNELRKKGRRVEAVGVETPKFPALPKKGDFDPGLIRNGTYLYSP